MERYSGRVLSRYYHQEVYIRMKRGKKYQDAAKSIDRGELSMMLLRQSA